MTAHAAKMKGLLTTAVHIVHESNKMHLNCKFNRRHGPTFTPNGADAGESTAMSLRGEHSFEPQTRAKLEAADFIISRDESDLNRTKVKRRFH